MPQQELLKIIVQILESCKIEYMLTGSYVSSLQGEPRSTHDIDVIVSIQKSDTVKFRQSFSKNDFYIAEQSIIDAIEHQSMFNVIDLNEGDKIDFWIITNEPFDQSRFSRKITEQIYGISVNVSTPEDTILMKLRWASISGGSEKQFTDALRVFEVQYEKLDFQYLENWIDQLQLHNYWKRIQNEAIIP